MGAVVKWLFGLILGLVVLIVAAIVILPMVIDPNDYKPQIVQTAQEKLGRDLAIDQDLSLSVFPWLGIETGGVRVGNAAGFKAENFAEIEQLGLKVKLMPLLSQRVEVDTLLLKGLRLNLEKDASGKTNWDDLAAGEAEPAAAEEAAGEQPVADGAGSDVSLTIQGIQIEDANISWDDRQAGQQYLLEGVRVVTGTLAPGQDVPVEAGVKFTSSQPAMTLDADLGATVSTDDALTVFSISGLALTLDAQGEGLPSGGAKLSLKTDLVADTKADTLTLDNLEISGPAMSATGRVAVSAMTTDPVATGSLRIAETNPKTLASMFASPLVTTDPGALTRAGGEMSFRYANGGVKLDPLQLTLDESTLNGYVHLVDPQGPVVRTALTLDQIDLDRYMPPAAEADDTAKTDAEKPAAKADSATAGAAADPFAALRPLDFIGEFSVGSLKVNNLRMQNVKTKIVSKQGVLKIDPMAADLYEGKYRGDMTLNAAGETPRMAAKQSLNGIQIGPLLGDLVSEDRLVGKGELEMDIRVVGMTEAEIRRSLNGTTRFAFRDGAVKGVNLAQIIREASTRLGLGGDKLDTGTPGQTDFSELSGSMTMTNGVIRNKDLSAKSPLLRVEGDGEVDLPKDTIDYTVVVELVSSLAGQGGKARSEVAGVPIPVRITGPLTNPKYAPDLEAALSAKAKAQLEEKKQELQDKAEDKIKEKLDGALRGLFN
jgi:AsmA protein